METDIQIRCFIDKLRIIIKRSMIIKKKAIKKLMKIIIKMFRNKFVNFYTHQMIKIT